MCEENRIAITTTLRKIREHNPCKDGWETLYKSLGGIKAYGLDTPLKFSQILESNNLDDTLWCLRSICPEHDKEVRLYAADCAESVLHIYGKEHSDDSPRKTIQAARDFANGLITDKELYAAWNAALSAVKSAASSDEWYAARSAARSDAWYAALSAVRSDAWDAAWDAARDAEQKAQEQMLIERFG